MIQMITTGWMKLTYDKPNCGLFDLHNIWSHGTHHPQSSLKVRRQQIDRRTDTYGTYCVNTINHIPIPSASASVLMLIVEERLH